MTSADCSHDGTGLTLALNGCEERLQFVLGSESGTLLASRQWTVPGQSVKFLVPGIAETMESLGLPMKDISRIAAVRGPGSFTGMRLVLAAAMGLAAGHATPVAGLDYLPLLAAGPAPLLDGVVHVLTYARRGLVYMQSFDAPQALLQSAPRALGIAEACEAVAGGDPLACLLGSGLRKNPEQIAALTAHMPGLRILDARWDNPTPETLLRAALNAEAVPGDIEPLYLRASDAEDNLPQIAAKRGMDPEQAQKRLYKYS